MLGPTVGALINIDYHMDVAMDGVQLGNGLGQNNKQITLDADKQWKQLASFSRETNVTIGQHYASAFAWIQPAFQPTLRASKLHTHGFTH